MSLELGHVNEAFADNEEYVTKIPDDSHYDEIDLSDKSANASNGGGATPTSGGAATDADSDARCGWCFFRPRLLQRFRTAKWVLFWLCWGGAVQGMVVNGFVNVVITTIERRFGLRSTQTGLVAGGYDIASFVCLVPVSYFGGRPGASKPRWLGAGIAVMGLGSLLFALPHFAVGPYRGASHVVSTCSVLNGTRSADCEHTVGDYENLSSYVWLFLLGQLLHGAGASPLYTLGVTFIDENVSKKMSSVYLGIYYTIAIIGPAVGFVLGGQLLNIYTDVLTVDPTEMGLTQDSKVWVGAWWIGFLLATFMCLLLAIPVLAFPPALPGAATIRAQKVSEAHGGSRAEAFSKLRELPRALCNLMGNPTFFFLNFAGASEGLLIAGFAAFLPKFIENQFSVSPTWAAMLVGLITVPAGGGGTFLGGYLVKRLNLHCAGIIKLCVISTLMSALFATCFFLTCPNLPYAGITAPYPKDKDLKPGNIILENSCNSRCGCNQNQFDPVCGVDGVMYYSPCYAGCTAEVSFNHLKAYTDCDCVATLAHNASELWPNTEGTFQVENRLCSSDCPYLWLFVVLAFGTMFFTFLSTMPALSATLRCVQEDQRSFALGIQWIKVRLVGTIPAPMAFGALIDDTCVHWFESCHGRGACLVYDNIYMGRYMLALSFIGKAASLLFFFLSWWFYIPPSGLNQALQAETPTSPDITQGDPIPTITMNGHTNHARDID